MIHSRVHGTLIHCEWFNLTQRHFVIDSKNSNVYFCILLYGWKVETIQPTLQGRSKCNTNRNSEVWLQKTMEIWRKAKQEAKGNMTKLKTEIGVITDNLNSDKFRKELAY